jgi:type I restriction enzyme, S subunit
VTVRWPMVSLGEVLTPAGEPHRVETERSYPNLGIYSFARGCFGKVPIDGNLTSAPTLYRVRRGQFIYSRLFAFEGAYAVVPDELDGAFVSNEFPCFDVQRDRVLPRYLRWMFSLPRVWAALAEGSKGMGDRRKRVHPDQLLAFRTALPPLDVQRRIVERLDAVEARIGRIKRLHSEIGSDLSEFVTSANAHFGTEPTRLGDALVLDEDRVAIAAGESYPQVGIRGFGGGLFPKPPVEAGATTYRHFNRLHAGHFVMSQVKGWEGAVAVCDATFEGMYASPEYRTFRCVADRLRPTYLSHLCATPWFHDQLALLTRGQGARRERLRPELLLHLLIPLPDVEAQTRLERSFDRLLRIRRGHDEDDLEHVVPALLAEAFGSS